MRVSFLKLAPLGGFGGKVMLFEPAQNGGLEPAKTEIDGIAFHLRQGESHRARIAVRRKAVDDRTPRIAKAEQLGDLIVGLTRSIVTSLTQQAIAEPFFDFKQVCMSAADH